MSTVDIGKFFEDRYEEYRSEHSRWSAERNDQEASLKQARREMDGVAAEISSKEKLKKQAAEGGLDTAPLDKQLDALRSKFTKMEKTATALAAELNKRGPACPFDPRTMREAAKIIAKRGCLEAAVVPTVGGLFDHIEIEASDLEADEFGRPVATRVSFGGQHVLRVKVVPCGSWFCRSFRPKSLDWIPPLAGEAEAHLNNSWVARSVPTAVIVADQGLLVLASTVYREEESREWGGQVTRKSVALEDAAMVMFERLAKPRIEAAGDVLDLQQEYADNPLMAAIRRKVLAQLTDKSRWAAAESRLNSSDTYAKIKTDWALFAAAPWTGSIDGAWAKLKYTVESGERPRFWCEVHAGHFGYRVRTRDHSWIVGKLFVDETQPPSQLGTGMESVNGSYGVQCLGRMYMSAHERRDD